MSDCSCNEFSRSQLLRRAVAEAGAGLPAIEPGMPAPAGSGLDRRGFLVKATGTLLAVYGASKLPFGAFEEGIAQAASSAASDRVIISVFLAGGADALSVLYPAGDPLYRKFRDKLRVSGGKQFTEDNTLFWHPAMTPIQQLHAEGKVSVAPAIGYTHPDQSHFTSRHFWEVGACETSLRTGWLGRYLDRYGSAANPFQGVSLDGSLAPALAPGRVPVAAIDKPENYSLWGPGVWGDVEDVMHQGLSRFSGYSDPAQQIAGHVASQVSTIYSTLAPFANDKGDRAYTIPVPYPSSSDSDFPDRLAGLAAMLAAGLPIRAATLTAPGEYDTHSNEGPALQEGLDLTAKSLLAFQRDLEARGLSDRVLVHVWSEFGRRAQENGSNGTDHGAAGFGLLIGSQVRGTMIGEFPGLKDGLDQDGNMKATADFRGLYSAILEQWMGADASAVIPGAGSFTRPKILKG